MDAFKYIKHLEKHAFTNSYIHINSYTNELLNVHYRVLF